MPQAVLAPAIGAAATLGGALIGSRQAGKATQSQERANAAALQFQREQDMARRQDWNRAMAAWEANRNALLRRYGVDVPAASYGAPQDMAGPQQPMGQGARAAIMPRRGGNLAELLGRGGYAGMKGY